MAVLKTQEIKIEELDFGKKKEAIRIMDEIRRRHKIKKGEKNSTEIIRYFREKNSR